jgi:hypothetical protein
MSNNETVTETVTEARRRGRPASFPGQETVLIQSQIPVEVRDQIRELAEANDELLNQTLARIVGTAYKQHQARQKRKKG